MCTVTFIPSGNEAYITSNRDEKYLRRPAIAPAKYRHQDITILYPKDADAGGSWIAMRDNGNAAVLLNGAFEKHIPSPPYKKSRGLVFLDMVKDDIAVRKFLYYDLANIEPFTLVVLEDKNLYECRWNGNKKFCKQLKHYTPHIWSSATLYDEQVVRKREIWFAKWLQCNSHPSQNDILNFHRFGGDGDEQNDLHMNRDGLVHTVSITSMKLNEEKGIMTYLDLKNNMMFHEQMEFISDYIIA
jgi:uncharacterized protein with NRDE domain